MHAGTRSNRSVTPGIRAETAIAAIRDALTPDLLHPNYAHEAGSHPAAGHCAVATEALWFALGGPASRLRGRVARDVDGTTHWWLEHASTGAIVDPTRDQFDAAGTVPPYERGIAGRPCGFMGIRRDDASPWGFGRRPSRRAAVVLERSALAPTSASPVRAAA